MGRDESTIQAGAPRLSRDERAKRARSVVNKTIPAILKANPRAWRGVEAAELIIDPPPSRPPATAAESGARLGRARPDHGVPDDAEGSKSRVSLQPRTGVGAEGPASSVIGAGEEGEGEGEGGRNETSAPLPNNAPAPPPVAIRLWIADTLAAAARLANPSPPAPPASSPSAPAPQQPPGRPPRVAVLNMASPLRPGGGVLSGATSQEESLCARTTLLPSLRDDFYRLPEVGAVYTPDVLVFGRWDADGSGADAVGEEMARRAWFYVDVVSAAMLRFPDVVDGDGDGEKRYAEQKDRELVVRKMRAVMRILRAKGAQRVVLGAWGCGAYGNPVGEIAAAWKKVLLGTGKAKRRKGRAGEDLFDDGEGWPGLEVVFAIKDARMAENFGRAFGIEVTDDTTGLNSGSAAESSVQDA